MKTLRTITTSAALSALLLMAPFAAHAGKNATTLRSFYAALDGGNMEKAAGYLAANVMAYLPLSPEALDKAGYKQLGVAFKTAFPNMLHQFTEIAESKGVVSFKGVFSGTNTGPMMGNPPTGNRVELPFLGYFKFDKAGAISEVNIQFNAAYFNAQLMAGLDPNEKIGKAHQTIRAAYDALNRKDWNAFAALCDERNYTDVGVAPLPLTGVREAIEAYKQFYMAFPDLVIAVNEVATLSPTRYLLRVSLSGTHKAPLMGVPATGAIMKYDDCDIVEFDAAGKIIYHQPLKGGPEVMRQIGFDPVSGANKAAALNIMQKLDQRNLEAVVAACDPAATFTGWAPQPVDAKGYKAAMGALIAAFPDARFHVEDVIAEGDKVVVRHRFEGTHSGAAFQGTPRSNKRAVALATVTFQFRDGKAAALWLNADFLGILSQIGAIGGPGK